MGSYTATVTLDRPHTGDAFADEVHGTDFDHFATVTSSDTLGRARILLTVPADTIDQADATVRALTSRLGDIIRIDLMTTTEFDRLTDPDTDAITGQLTLPEAAAQLGITRQAVLGRIQRGTLPGHKIGDRWVVPAHALNH